MLVAQTGLLVWPQKCPKKQYSIIGVALYTSVDVMSSSFLSPHLPKTKPSPGLVVVLPALA